jgi:hypothetical protein
MTAAAQTPIAMKIYFTSELLEAIKTKFDLQSCRLVTLGKMSRSTYTVPAGYKFDPNARYELELVFKRPSPIKGASGVSFMKPHSISEDQLYKRIEKSINN